MKITAIITCAGKGTRAGFDQNKLLKPLENTTVAEKTISVFANSPLIDDIIITSSRFDVDFFNEIANKSQKNCTVILGGDTRTQSVYNALKQVKGDVVLIHDGARPFVTQQILQNCINSVKKYGSGITCVPLTDTLALSPDGENISGTARDGYFSVQTPQGFFIDKILSAYEKAIESGETFTDDSGIYAKYVGAPHICQGDTKNKKLTYPEDFESGLLVGTGFDLHRLVEDRKLILGGIEIPHTKGLLGHSDADVVTHAVMDAFLSALSLGDIGKHFPDTDPKYKGISSILLLQNVMELVWGKGYKVRNVAIVIMAEKPKLSTYTEKISTYLAKVIHIAPEKVGITCTTLEKIGPIGHEEAIACQTYCMLEKM